LAGIFIVYAA